MAKRFTDTDKYKKRFVRSLPGPYKLLWDFLYHDCNHAGIWQVDFDVAQIMVGIDMPISESDALNLFADKVVPFDNGEKWFIPSFVVFQYGTLSESNRAHSSVIEQLKKYELAPCKPLTTPLQGCKDMVKDKDKDKDKLLEILPDSLNTEKFIAEYVTWINYHREMNKPLTKTSIAAQLKTLGKLGVEKACEMIQHTIAMGWQGLRAPDEKKFGSKGGTPEQSIDFVGTCGRCGTVMKKKYHPATRPVQFQCQKCWEDGECEQVTLKNPNG